MWVFAHVLALSVTHAARAHAQPVQALPPCTGDSITAIDYRVSPRSAGKLDGVARNTSAAVRSWFPATRDAVVRAYLRVKVGEVCTEFDRSESERVLRSLPFLASASVRAVPDGPGRVRLQVDVVDELPILATGALRGGTLGSVTIGTLNLAGHGLAMNAQFTRGFAYRNGIGVHALKYGAFGMPYFVAATVERNVHGDVRSFEFANPFLTARQRKAFQAAVTDRSYYAGVVPATGPDVALHIRRVSYDAGWVRRIGIRSNEHATGFFGGAVLGETTHIDDAATIISDTGLVRAGDAALSKAYPDISAVRIAAIGGLRAIRFLTVRGFDALSAAQDVGVGVQLHALAGPSLEATAGRREIFVAGDLYAGVGSERSFVSVHVQSEARGLYNSPSWDGLVSSARLSWYTASSPAWTRIVSVSAAAVRKLDFPAQLTFRSADGGVAGYSGARAAGGQRVVARVEQRRLLGLFRSRGDLAIAAFADAGKLWSGDVPYGQTTPIRSALGFSVLAAYPAGGKRMYRVDVAVPLSPERGGARFEIRLSALDRTRLLWLEPRDVARLRTAAVPLSLMKW